MAVRISKRSQKLIIQYLKVCNTSLNINIHSEHYKVLNHYYVDIDVLISWLTIEESRSDKESGKETELILTSLRTALLQDLNASMPGYELDHLTKESNSSIAKKIKFISLALAGTLFAACQGFDSVTILMGVTLLPAVFILAAGLFFSIFSVLIFYGGSLLQISNSLGINLRETPKLLDIYLLQQKEIKSISKKVSTYNLAELPGEELARLKKVIIMLEKRFAALNAASRQFEQALQNKVLKVVQGLFSGISGLLFFGSGFFAGQSVALYITGLFLTTISTAFWPVVLFSLIVGISAFSVYWNVERMGVMQLISSWFGLEEKKVDALCDKKKLFRETFNLNNLKEKITQIDYLSTQNSPKKHKKSVPDQDDSAKVTTGKNNHSFYQPFTNEAFDLMESSESDDEHYFCCGLSG